MANGKSPLKILGPEIIGLLAIFAIILGILNYFNIISLSQIYPNLFGSLPQKSYTPPTPTPLTSIPCPVDPEFCSTGRLIATTSGETKFYALAYNLPKGTNLTAVFNGTSVKKIESDINVKPHPVINFTKSDQENISVIYNFYGDVINPLEEDPSHGFRTFKASETVGIISDSNFPNIEPFNGANFLFLVKQYEKYYNLKVSGNKINLSLQ